MFLIWIFEREGTEKFPFSLYSYKKGKPLAIYRKEAVGN
jgi:hypothetical protein